MKKDYEKQIETMKNLTLEEIRQRLGEKVIVKTIRCWKMWPTKPHTIVEAVDCYGNETGEVWLWDGSRTWSESAIVNGNIEVYGEYRLF